MGQLEGRVALVTGGSDGIGRGIAEAFLREGAKVAISGRSPDKAAKTIDELGAGEDLVFVQADASSSEHAGRAVDGCLERFGRLDILVNNVGGASSQFGLVHELTDAGWDDGIKLNLYSAFWTTRRALPSMLDCGWGRIINISSVNAIKGQFGQTNYSAAKAGMAGFSKALAQEVVKKGVTVNTVSPGYVETDLVMAIRAEVREQIIASIPMGRLARPDEVAAVVAFLASEEAGYITGANISVNGGMHMM